MREHGKVRRSVVGLQKYAKTGIVINLSTNAKAAGALTVHTKVSVSCFDVDAVDSDKSRLEDPDPGLCPINQPHNYLPGQFHCLRVYLWDGFVFMGQKRKLSFYRNARCRSDQGLRNFLEWNDYSLRIIVYHPVLQSMMRHSRALRTISMLSM